jgi:hypothetical protein
MERHDGGSRGGTGGSVGGGNVVWYQFDEQGGATAVDSSGQGNHGVIAVSGSAAGWTNVPVDLAPSSETIPLYLVFSEGSARVNWFDFGEFDEDPGPGPHPVCELVPVTERDDFDGDSLDDEQVTSAGPLHVRATAATRDFHRILYRHPARRLHPLRRRNRGAP